MAKYSRIEVFQEMERVGLVPLFYHAEPSVAIRILQACYNGGVRTVEFTSRGDFAHEIFRELSQYAQNKLPGMILGVGSITDAASASLYMHLGANFIVTPVLREDIATICNRRKVLWSPGCGSLSEIARAEEFGCELVKLFPGDTYGPKFVKALKGPQPWTHVMPTGGVTPDEESLRSWFKAGVSCVGIGSKLITKELIKSGDMGTLTDNIRECVEWIQKVRAT